MTNEQNSPPSGMTPSVSHLTVDQFIRNLHTATGHLADKGTPDDWDQDEHITDVAVDFQTYLDDTNTPADMTPPEWFAAWDAYCNQDGEEEEDDGQPDEEQEWYDYDPDA